MSLALDIHGNGQVAKALVAVLPPDMHVRSIHDSKGPVFQDVQVEGQPVFVDCTAPAYGGERRDAWNAKVAAVLASGMTIVTANKAPLATAAPARTARQGIGASATVGGGTPILDLVVRLAPDITAIELVASGTLSAVCDAVAGGSSIVTAISAAKDAGFAEPDPRLDLDGTDTLAKAIIVHNQVWPDAPLGLDDVTARLALHPGPIQAIARRGGTPRAVAHIERGRIRLDIADAPWAGPAGHAAVRIQAAGTFVMHGPGAGPETTARNLLADLRRIQQRQVAALAN